MVDVPSYGRRPRFEENAVNPVQYEYSIDLCPGAGLSRSPDLFQRQGVIKSLFKEWGPILRVWEGHAADPEIRFKGSSGGALSAISLFCLEHEGMYGVLHTQSDEQTPYLNKTVMSKDRDSILAAAGSRYSPASPCERLQDVENADSPCVFIGKPCDVAGLQRARQLRPELDRKVGLAMSCFCAGTPSTNGTLEMLRHVGIESPDRLVSLRYRGFGWPGKTRIENYSEAKLISRELTYQQSWGDILQKYRQWRCYICPDHTGEFGDISTGDPWYKETGDDAEGQSLIIARTEKGKMIVERAIAAGYIVAEQVDAGFFPASQKNLLKARARLWGQLFALALVQAPHPVYRGFRLFTTWNDHLNFNEKVQSILGTLKRVYSKKIKKKIEVPSGID